METQKQTILRFLKSNVWVCGTEFQKACIPEFRSLINVITKEGTTVYSRPCKTHTHRSKVLKEWSLQNPVPNKDTCPHCKVWLNHSINCPTKAKKEVTQLF